MISVRRFAEICLDKSVEVQVSMPDGESIPVIETCKGRVRIQAYQCLVMLCVTCLADHFDAILGEPWLLQHNSCLVVTGELNSEKFRRA